MAERVLHSYVIAAFICLFYLIQHPSWVYCVPVKDNTTSPFGVNSRQAVNGTDQFGAFHRERAEQIPSDCLPECYCSINEERSVVSINCGTRNNNTTHGFALNINNTVEDLQAISVRKLQIDDLRANHTSDTIEELQSYICGYPRIADLNIRANNLLGLYMISCMCFNELRYISLTSTTTQEGGISSLPMCVKEDVSVVAIHGSMSGSFPGNISELCFHHTIDCSHNNITTLVSITHKNESVECPLSQLNLSHNAINNVSEFSFVGWHQLQVLDLSHNHIRNIDGVFGHDTLVTLTHLNLSNNRMNSLREFTFSRLTALIELNLADNQLSQIDEGVLSCHLAQLQTLNLAGNNMEILGGNQTALADLLHLRHLDISRNKLQVIDVNSNGVRNWSSYITDMQCNATSWTNNTFRQISMETIDLSHNNMTEMNEELFNTPISKVKKLNLAHNRLTGFPRYATEKMPRLEVLDLQHNSIFWLDVGTFTSKTLKYINLSNNRLKKLISMTFLFLPNIQYINLRGNGLSYIYKLAFYKTCKHNQNFVIDFNENKLHGNVVWKLLTSFRHLVGSECVANLHLRGNKITGLLPNNLNKIRDHLISGDFTYFEVWDHVQLHLQGNPLECNCNLKKEISVIKQIKRTYGRNLTKPHHLHFWSDLHCHKPRSLSRMTAEEAFPSMGCGHHSACPRYCACFHSPEDDVTTVNCSTKQLTSFPPNFPKAGRIKVLLSDNFLTVLHKLPDLSNVTLLDVSFNTISTITSRGWKELRKVQGLLLHYNLLRDFPNIMRHSGLIRNLTLRGNPISCGCDNLLFLQWVHRHHGIISDVDDMLCDTEQRLVTVNTTDVCYVHSMSTQNKSYYSPWLVILGIIVATILSVIVILSITLLRCSPRARNLLLKQWNWYRVHVESEKRYDIILFYSNSDQFWVEEQLEDTLKEPALTLCLYQRDHGDTSDMDVADLLPELVDISRHCIIVISEHFIHREWQSDSTRLCVRELLESFPGRFSFVILDDSAFEQNSCILETVSEHPHFHVAEPDWLLRLRTVLPLSNQDTDLDDVDADTANALMSTERY